MAYRVTKERRSHVERLLAQASDSADVAHPIEDLPDMKSKKHMPSPHDATCKADEGLSRDGTRLELFGDLAKRITSDEGAMKWWEQHNRGGTGR